MDFQQTDLAPGMNNIVDNVNTDTTGNDQKSHHQFDHRSEALQTVVKRRKSCIAESGDRMEYTIITTFPERKSSFQHKPAYKQNRTHRFNIESVTDDSFEQSFSIAERKIIA